MTTTTFATSNRIHDLVARQRSGRLRDLSFSLVLAAGVLFGVGSLGAAAASASEASITAPALPVTAAVANAPICHDAELHC